MKGIRKTIWRHGMGERHDNEPPLYRVMWAFLGAIIGGALVWLCSTRELHVLPLNVSYDDLSAVALTAVTVILAVYGLAAAFAALYGYREFMKRSSATAARIAKMEATPAAIAEVQEYLRTQAEPFLKAQAESVAVRVITPEALRDLIREQINAVTLGDSKDDKMDAAVEQLIEADPLDALDDDEAETQDLGDDNAHG